MNINTQSTKVFVVLLSVVIILLSQFFSANSQVIDSTDVGIVEVVLPESNGYCNISEVVHIKIANYGFVPISNFQLEYSFINYVYQDTIIATEIFTGTLIPGDTIDYYFNQLTGLSGIGIMPIDFNFLINYIFDSNQANNSVNFVLYGPELLMGYLYPNEEPVVGSIPFSYYVDYYIFDVTEDVEEVCISLCGSSFDTQLSIYRCTQSTYLYEQPLYYNNNYCGLQSQITVVNLSAGRYYADVYGWTQSGYGQYIIEYTTKYKHTINLPQGWSIISSYITPDNLNMQNVFSSQINNISIVKDENGSVFWPQYNVNLIGNFNNLEGYQIKTTTSINLDMIGIPVNPDTCLIEISTGWNIIPYLNNESDSITTMLQPVSNNIIIVKDGDGAVYWPQFSVNMIQVLNPGEGYQIKSANSDTLIYPAY